MAIPEHTIQEIKQRADVLEIISDFLSVKRKGQNYWACCPFHDEKTPSFSINPAKGFYKCFGCGKFGDAIDFVQEHEGMSYVEALQYIGKKYNITIEQEALTPEERTSHSLKESLFILLNFAGKYFVKQLWEQSEGMQIGLSYLRERGFSDALLKEFGIGYSLNEWDAFLKEAKQKGHDTEKLAQVGLIISKENKTYDRFRGRVMFPIHDVSGRIVGFGARRLTNDTKQPKYINSPESEVYNKSTVLYGIYQEKNAIRTQNKCYLVEGYTDVMALHQAGIKSVVASSGTSLTDGQVKLLKRYTTTITLLFDGDQAGLLAALRGVDMILKAGLQVRVVVFPEGEDPDSFAKKSGAQGLEEYLQSQEHDFITFQSQLLLKDAKQDPVKTAEAVSRIVESISYIPDQIQRAMHIKACSTRFGLEEYMLTAELNKHLIKRHRKSKDKPEELPNLASVKPASPQYSTLDEGTYLRIQERESLRLLLNYGFQQFEEKLHVYEYLLEELDQINMITPVYQQIVTLYKTQLAAGQLPDTISLMKESEGPLKEALGEFITKPYELSSNWENKYHIYVPEQDDVLPDLIYKSVLRLKLRVVRKLIQENMAKLQDAEDEARQQQIIKVHQALKTSEQGYAKLLGNVILN